MALADCGGLSDLSDFSHIWQCITLWTTTFTAFAYIFAALFAVRVVSGRGTKTAVFVVSLLWGALLGFLIGSLSAAAIAGMYVWGPGALKPWGAVLWGLFFALSHSAFAYFGFPAII